MNKAWRLTLVPLVLACGASQPPPVEAKTAPGGSKDQTKWPSDDHSMCDWRNKPELEISETAGPGAIRPNIRRVYKTVGDAENRHRTLICREVDTNLDGIKDTVRTFNTKGEAQHEESDANFDGKIDHWLSFAGGSMVEEDIDTLGDGKPHEWKYYLKGQLSRVKRDRHGTGKPDVWEIYTNGQLERMGVDDTGDGHVDRWDRDDILRQQQDAEEAAKIAALQGDAGVGVPSTPNDRALTLARPGLRQCYQKVLQTAPSAGGTVVVDATPSKDGCHLDGIKITNAGATFPPAFTTCVETALKRMDLCADKGTTITVPIHFSM